MRISPTEISKVGLGLCKDPADFIHGICSHDIEGLIVTVMMKGGRPSIEEVSVCRIKFMDLTKRDNWGAAPTAAFLEKFPVATVKDCKIFKTSQLLPPAFL